MLQGNIIVAWLALLSVYSVARPTKLTNAQRLKRGLKLNAPKRLYDASNTWKPKRSTPSGTSGSGTSGSGSNTSGSGSNTSGSNTSGSLSHVIVGNNGGGTRKRSGSIAYLEVLDDGELGTTTDITSASFFILPTPEDEELQWVPMQATGGFAANAPYPMFVATSPATGVAQLQFSPNPPVNAVSNLFGSTSITNGFAPQYNGTSLLLLTSSNGTVYTAASKAIADSSPLAQTMNFTAVAAESFPENATAPTEISPVAISTLNNQLANTQASFPLKLWARDSSGQVSAWVDCFDEGQGCTNIQVDPTSNGLIFYQQYQNYALAQDLYTIADGVTEAVGLTANGIEAANLGSVALNSAGTLQFLIPTSNRGIINSTYNGGADQFVTEPFSADDPTSPLWISLCDGSCDAVIPICIEAVPLGDSPYACKAYWDTVNAHNGETNPMQLYVTQISPVASGATPISGWVYSDGGDLSFLISQDQSESTTYYFPSLGSSPGALYWVDSNDEVHIGEILPTTVYPYSSRKRSSIPIAQPYFPLSNEVDQGWTTSWVSMSSIPGGILGASAVYNGETMDYALFAVDNQISLLSSYSDARAWQPSAVQVCMESVQVGEQPVGACQKYVQNNSASSSPTTTAPTGSPTQATDDNVTSTETITSATATTVLTDSNGNPTSTETDFATVTTIETLSPTGTTTLNDPNLHPTSTETLYSTLTGAAPTGGSRKRLWGQWV